MAFNKNKKTHGERLHEEFEASVGDIHQRAVDRHGVVLDRIAELEHESSVLSRLRNRIADVKR